MVMARNNFGDTRGPSGNEALNQLKNKRATDQRIRDTQTWALGIVVKYHSETNTVDVVFKDNLTMQPIQGVRVMGLGGNGMRFYGGLKGIDDAAVEPDVGLILFPPGDTRRIYEDYERRAPKSKSNVKFNGALFLPGVPIDLQEDPSNLAQAVGPGDAALLNQAGAGMILQEDGDLILRGKKIYAIGLDEDISAAKRVKNSLVTETDIFEAS